MVMSAWRLVGDVAFLMAMAVKLERGAFGNDAPGHKYRLRR